MNFALTAEDDRAHVEMAPSGLHNGVPLALKRVPVEDLDVWRRIAKDVTHPAAKAHFYDLLFKKGGPRALNDAVEAVHAYMEVAKVDHYEVQVGEEEERQFKWAAHNRNMAMGRALSLRHVVAKDSASAALVEEVQGLALRCINRILLDPSPHIGDLLMLVRLLTRGRRTLAPQQSEALKVAIEQALHKHQDRDHVIDDLVAQLILLEPSRADELNRVRVQARLTIAESQPHASVKMIHLERAATLARNHQFRDLHDEAIKQMQRISPEDLGFQTFSSEAPLQAEVLAAEIQRVSEGADWRDSLTSWLQTGSPSGNAESNREGAEALAQVSLVSQLGMPSIVYGRDGLPRWTASTDDERRQHELARHEMFAVNFNGLVLAEGLDAIGKKYATPNVEDLTLLLSHDGAGDVALAGMFARALLRYWSGDFEGALMTAALRVETGARHLAVALDEAAYVTSRQTAPAVYLGIAPLIDLLEKHGLDEDWKRFLLTYFVSPEGRSLRHDLAHGFGPDDDKPRIEAALSLRALGLFVNAAWQPGKDTAPATPVVGLHSTGLVEAAYLLFRHAFGGVPVTTLVRHEARSLLRIARNWRRG
ncbi:hypothetical protein [Aeromicrobium ginsengisoli]|uniref:DUF4209 domain-containing protein n=1 Tax=Aeromicrobium ginsengisoli TaxID=363867 RepID=A0A5M4FJ84_9ACTN|nr:hypothetical protein [Aeromicrobium ginsengisoli]KAA1399655.1 hypothetical protein ESP70_002520 [Aeromicrobium ginsengisoli]